MTEKLLEATNLSLVPNNPDAGSENLPVINQGADEDSLLLTPYDRIERINSCLDSVERTIAITTPFSFEENKEGYIASVKAVKAEIKKINNQINNLEIIISEAYPTFTWFQRMTILWFTFWGRGLDKMRIDQLWSFSKTNAQYQVMCKDLRKRIATAESKLDFALRFAKINLTDEFSQVRKAKIIESRNAYIDSKSDLLNLVNYVCSDKYISIEKIPLNPGFANFTEYSAGLVSRANRLYEGVCNHKAPEYANLENYRALIRQIIAVVKKDLAKYDVQLRQIDLQIALEVDKIFV